MSKSESSTWLNLAKKTAEEIRIAADRVSRDKDTPEGRRALSFLQEEASNSDQSRFQFYVAHCEPSDEISALVKQMQSILAPFKHVDSFHDTKIEPPDFTNLESCRRLCNTLYAEVREKLKSRVHSETQAVSYILSGAKEGDLYYEDCLNARRIKKEWNWTRTTFTTYCKQKPQPKPKTIKRAAKKGRHIRERKRMLRDL